jgi:hypothetical protein
MLHALYEKGTTMKHRIVSGRLSLIELDGPHPQLLVDGIPLLPGQVLLTQYGKGEVLPGRVSFDSKKREWYLDREEFIGHTYLNIPLTPSWFDELSVRVVKERQ